MPGVFVYAGILGIASGIALRGVFYVPGVFTVSCACLSVIGIALCMKRNTLRSTVWCAVFVTLLGGSLGVLRADIEFSKNTHLLDARLGQTTLEGIVVREPEFTESSQKMLVAVTLEEKTARVYIITNPFPEFRYGDTVRVSGNLRRPEPFTTDEGRKFDYPRFLAKEGAYYQMIFPEVAVVSRDGGNALYRLLFSARRGFLMAIRSFLSEPSAGLVAGVTVGEKGGIDKQTEEMFRRVGLIHIVVLSGYNITVVSDMVMRILSFLPRVLMLTFGGVAILFFVVATGASATAVRAGGMAVLALCARYVGARYDIVRALFFVAGGMLLYNPYTLYDPSFQLSFLATLGLITYSPILERKLFWVPKILSLRETLSTTLATQLFVLPLIVYLSGQVSLVSVFANIIVLPVVPMLMFFGSVLGIVAGIFSHAGFVLSFPAMAVSEYVLNVSEMFSRIPYSSVQVPYFSEAIVWCSYAVLVIILIRSRVRTSHVSSPN